MTQIKLRRDTSANFASKNPVLGLGEPAYETDTKKLKIGDGTTAYTQLEYFSTGGGGSVTDAYTKAETDELLDEKQNNLKTISPLNISNISSESVKNFLITSDSLKAYTNYAVELSASSSRISFTGGRDMVSYIDIPYKFGQVVTYPFPINSTFLSICFGKFDADGYFEPILTFYNNNGYLGTIVSDKNATWSGDAFAPCSQANSGTRRYDFSNPRNLGFAQIIFQSGSLVDIYSSFPYDLARPIFFKNEITDNEKISRIQEISVARFVTSTYVGTNKTFNVSDLGLYNILNPPVNGMDFSDYISGNSLYDITKNIEVNNSYLQLNIDNTLKINNNELGVNSIVTTQGNTFNGASQLVKLDSSGKLPAIDGSQLTNLPGGSSEPPANMVTTDTTQTITGLKTFGGTDLSKILLEGSKSLIGFRQNSDSLPTTLIGGFFNSNGEKSITIGSTDHETLSLNAKSVQDGSGNKFLTSGDKETIMGYIMPDYSTRTEVPWDTDNTAPTDGYVEVMGQGDGRTSAFVLEYTINGVRTAVSACYATAANTNFRLPVICPKGTVYRASKGAVMHELHFISMKGAV